MTAEIKPDISTNVSLSPKWNVIIIDDPVHSFAYVTDLIVNIFKRNIDDAKALTEEVHRMGKAIVITCSKERAELYVEQVKSYGDDPFIKIFRGLDSGPIKCIIEQER